MSQDNLVILQSTKSAHVYHTRRRKKGETSKLELRKFDPVSGTHAVYKEVKKLSKKKPAKPAPKAKAKAK